MCLYGNSDSSWTVGLPAEEIPSELPEPTLGINHARDGMQVGVPDPTSPLLSLGLEPPAPRPRAEHEQRARFPVDDLAGPRPRRSVRS